MEIAFTPTSDPKTHEILIDGTIVGAATLTKTGYEIESLVPGAFWSMHVTFKDLGGDDLESDVAPWVEAHADDFESLEDE